jgi:hypothetical protein
MKASKLEKIIEEELKNKLGVTLKDTIYLPKETSDAITVDSQKVKNVTLLSGSVGGQGNNNASNNFNEKDQVRERVNSKLKTRIEIVKTNRELKNIKESSSFFEGRPRCEDDIVKLECPLYRCTSNTIIRKKTTKIIYDQEPRPSNASNDIPISNRQKSINSKITRSKL